MHMHENYDVVVVGGGPAGIGAAVGAAICGAKTILIERNPYLGGNATNSGVANLCGFYAGQTTHQIVGGVGQLVLNKLCEMGENTDLENNIFSHAIICVDIESLKLALDRIIAEHSIKLLLDALVVDARVESGRIKEIVYADDCGLHTIEGTAYVDTTGDGNLAAFAQNDVMFGTPNDVQMSTMIMWVDGADSDALITDESLNNALQQAHEAGYHMTKLKTHIWRSKKGTRLMLALPNYKLSGLSAEELTKAERDVREQSYTYIQAIRKYMPGMKNSYLASTGPKIGIRESRRLKCDRLLTIDEVLGGKTMPDSIAVGGWPIEVHNKLNQMSVYKHEFDKNGYKIPLGCLKANYPDNLWCGGRNICVDQQVLASARVMGTCFATGQAAGVAAAKTGPGSNYDIESIREELIKQGAIL